MYGASIAHLTGPIENSSAADKQKLTGYVKIRRDSKALLGCALFMTS